MRRVLARERAAAVAGEAAVGVDDDLAAGQARVADGAADDEAARRVDQEVGLERVRVVEVGRDDRDDDVLPEVGRDLLARGLLGVLRGDEQLLDGDRAAVDVADRDLRLAVGTQVAQRAVLADRGEPLGQAVREADRGGHELGRLVGRVAEHHPLVAGAGDRGRLVVAALTSLEGGVDALRDVGGLLVQRVEDRGGVGAEAEVAVDVADLADRLASDLLRIEVGRRGDLARDHDQARVDQRLAGDTTVRILRQHGIQHTVGDLIGDLVRMTLGHGLGREEILVVGKPTHA